MAKYRPTRRPKPAPRSRAMRAVLDDPRIGDLAGGDPLGVADRLRPSFLAAWAEDWSEADLPDRSFGAEDFWPED